MLLSDQTIAELAIDEELIVPFHTEQLQPCSYDVTLAPTIRYLSPDPIDHQDNGGPAIYADTKDFIGLRWATHYMFHAYALSPGEFILASTNEKVKIPDDIAARFEGKSSLGRMGLTTHITAGFIDAGFEGEITLEMKNETEYPIYISPDMKIGQLCFFALDRAARRPYGSEGLGSHYQGQSGPTTAC